MAIFSYKCQDCQHGVVCKIKDKIDVFHEDAKKQLGVDITLETCLSFDEVNED